MHKLIAEPETRFQFVLISPAIRDSFHMQSLMLICIFWLELCEHEIKLLLAVETFVIIAVVFIKYTESSLQIFTTFDLSFEIPQRSDFVY